MSEDIASVVTAVGHLQELGTRMKSSEFGFRDDDIGNLDGIIESINELESERQAMKENFETETIKSSVLRHELKLLPAKIREEVMLAVSAARQSNADALKDLREKLEEMTENILDLEMKAQQFEQENAVLQPERELLRQQHDEIIAQLNQKMADKASMQIVLNETRDKVRQSNQDIVDLEDGILQLKEDLIQERTEARQEKKRLTKAVIDTQTKTKDQKELNVEKKKELDSYQQKLVESEAQLDTLRKAIRKSEAAKSKLEEDEKNLIEQLSQQLKLNDELRKKGLDFMEEKRKEQDEFEKKENELKLQIETHKKNIEKQEEKTIELDEQKQKITEDLEGKEQIKSEDSLYISELDSQLQGVKNELTQSAQEVGRMQTENVEMTQQIEELAESHKAVVAQLKNQIDDFTEQLNKERQERMDLQKHKDQVFKDLNDTKTDQQVFIAGVTETIQEGKRKHVILSNEGLQLQKEIKDEDENLKELKQQLETAKHQLEELARTMKDKINKMESEIQSMGDAVVGKKEELETYTPKYHELQAFFEKRTQEYDSVLKQTVALKNKKMGLEDTIGRGKREKEGMKVPKEVLTNELKSSRGLVLDQLKEHGKETQNIEGQIYNAGCQLRLVMEENQKLEEACKQMEENLVDLDKQRKENERIKIEAENELQLQKSELVKLWTTDNMMEQYFARRDQATVEAFGSLVDNTERRENKINGITLRLGEELTVLSEFLDNLAARRPEGKTKSKSMAKSKVKKQIETKQLQTVNKDDGNRKDVQKSVRFKTT